MKRLIISLAILLCSIIMPTPLLADSSSSTQVFQSCTKGNLASTPTICNDQNTTQNPVNHILKVAANIVALMTGIAAVIVIIIGGITMISSGGNTESVAKARKQIMAAIIGLVIVALAWSIITFLTNHLIKT